MSQFEYQNPYKEVENPKWVKHDNKSFPKCSPKDLIEVKFNGDARRGLIEANECNWCAVYAKITHYRVIMKYEERNESN